MKIDIIKNIITFIIISVLIFLINPIVNKINDNGLIYKLSCFNEKKIVYIFYQASSDPIKQLILTFRLKDTSNFFVNAPMILSQIPSNDQLSSNITYIGDNYDREKSIIQVDNLQPGEYKLLISIKNKGEINFNPEISYLYIEPSSVKKVVYKYYHFRIAHPVEFALFIIMLISVIFYYKTIIELFSKLIKYYKKGNIKK